MDFPKITSERLTLRMVENTDWETIFLLRTNEIVNKFINRKKIKSKEDTLAFLKKVNDGFQTKDFIFWGIELNSNNKLIGTICLWKFKESSAEVGYELNPDYHSHGFMSESLQSVLNYGFDILNLKNIDAYTHKQNLKSRELLEKNKFSLNESITDENNSNNFIYRKLNSNIKF